MKIRKVIQNWPKPIVLHMSQRQLTWLKHSKASFQGCYIKQKWGWLSWCTYSGSKYTFDLLFLLNTINSMWWYADLLTCCSDIRLILIPLDLNNPDRLLSKTKKTYTNTRLISQIYTMYSQNFLYCLRLYFFVQNF